jgi:hypothetical protein
VLRELGARSLERTGVAGVDDETEAALGEHAGEGEAEASRGAGDDDGVHADDATAERVERLSGIGPRTGVRESGRESASGWPWPARTQG